MSVGKQLGRITRKQVILLTLRCNVNASSGYRPEGFLEQLYGQNPAFGTVQRLIPNSG